MSWFTEALLTSTTHKNWT